MAVSKRVRYEVLRRDNHACRYCGASAPDVELTVDHVVPVALGGSDDPSNLVAACRDCNAGKTSTTPDGPLVADVEAKAVQWAQAMKLVASERATERAEHNRVCDFLYEHWQSERPNPWRAADLPDDWMDSIRIFMQAGLTVGDLEEMISVAMRTRTVSQKWKYFCGCCWKLVRQAQDQAKALVSEAGGESERDLFSAASVGSQYHIVAQMWREQFGTELAECLCRHTSGSAAFCGVTACKLSLICMAQASCMSFDYVAAIVSVPNSPVTEEVSNGA